MYPKGGNMLHTIRQIVDNDDKWREILRGLNRDFYHQTVDGAQVEAYIAEHSGKKLDKVFDQYLRQRNIPVFEYSLQKGRLRYRWANCVEGFDMPLKVTLERRKFSFIYPTTEWQEVRVRRLNKKTFEVDPDFYVLIQDF
jgi:aminopeptidase N